MTDENTVPEETPDAQLAALIEARLLPLVQELLDSSDDRIPVRMPKRIKEANGSENYVDSGESFDGWLPLTMGNQSLFDFNEAQLQLIRDACRIVATTDEVAKNVIKHYQNFIVGEGIRVVILPTDLGSDPDKISDVIDSDTKIATMHTNWSAFYAANKMTARLKNWVERTIRDGEVLVRVFDAKFKFARLQVPVIRFIDPALVRTTGKNDEFGMVVDPDDVETVKSYVVVNPDTQIPKPVPAEEVIHDKRNVDPETPRGVSGLWPVLVNIRRISKNLRNVSVLTSILSAIALIRKHTQGTSPDKLQRFLSNNNDGQRRTNAVSGRTVPSRHIAAGTVLDAPMGMEYETPAHNVKSQEFTSVIDKELAHVGLAFVLPVEWLLGKQTESPLGAGSPVTKNFIAEQNALFAHLEDLFWHVQILMGVPAEERLKYNIRFFGPALALDKALDEARVSEIDIRNGSLSPQTRAAQMGRDWAFERAQMIKHRKTKQPDEVMPGDAGNTNVTSEQPSAGQGGDGTTTKDKSQRKSDGAK